MNMLGISSRTETIRLDALQGQRVDLCNESLRNSLARLLLWPLAMLTNPIAVRRVLSDLFVGSRLTGRDQGRVNGGVRY